MKIPFQNPQGEAVPMGCNPNLLTRVYGVGKGTLRAQFPLLTIS